MFLLGAHGPHPYVTYLCKGYCTKLVQQKVTLKLNVPVDLVDVTSLDSLQIRSRSNLVPIPPKASA